MMEVVPQVARARTRCGLRAIKLDGYSRLPRRVGSSHPELRAGGKTHPRKTYKNLERETVTVSISRIMASDSLTFFSTLRVDLGENLAILSPGLDGHEVGLRGSHKSTFK